MNMKWILPCMPAVLWLIFAVNPAEAQTAGFTIPNPVCSGQPVTITNTSAGGSNFYWNFCSAAIDINPSAVNLGNPGGMLVTPTYVKCVQDAGNYYAFLPNHYTGTLTRLSFGNSLLNTPVAYNLGRIGGLLPLGHEGFQVVYDNGNWYGFSVGGDGQQGPSCIVRIDFGASLSNNSPVATNLGNPGNTLAFPMDIKFFREGNDWLAFIVSIQPSGPNSGTGTNMITRINFGSSLANPAPVAVSLGNLGNMAYPTGICEIKENGNWHFLICNVDNHSITRLDFGASLLNVPTAVNLGNPGGLLNGPRDMQFLRTCDGLYGYAVNALGSPTRLIRLQFAGGMVTGALSATNLGNLGGMAGVHPMSDFFRVGDSLYSFVPNVSGNTLTRLALGSCTNSGIPSAASASPPPVIFPLANTTYPVNLLMDEGLPTQTAYCSNVTTITPVIDSVTIIQPVTCGGQDGALLLHTNMPNVTGGIYYTKDGVGILQQPVITDPLGKVRLDNLGSGVYDSIRIFFNGCESLPVGPYLLSGPASVHFTIEIFPAEQVCEGDTVLLGTSVAFSNPVYLWSTGVNLPSIRVTRSGIYWLEITDGQCSGRDSVTVVFSARPVVDIGDDTTICAGDTYTIGEVIAGANYLWNTGSTQPVISVSEAGTYQVLVSRGGCVMSDSVSVNIASLPYIDLGGDRNICPGQTILLDAGNVGSRYSWNNGSAEQRLPVSAAGLYYVTVVSPDRCIGRDSILLTDLPDPVVALGMDTTVCEETPLLLRPVVLHSDWLVWSDGSTDAVLSVKHGGVYTVTGTNECGVASDTINIHQIFCDIWMPNVFTPNGDGKNDVFRVLGNLGRLDHYGLSIFDRWGQRVFYTLDKYQGWDGFYKDGACVMGTYVYMLEYHIDGKPVLDKGNFHLLR